ncbi:MAG: SUMF1/EgtB/PvdO family nonheme iron enzyme [Planctomycetota bacterium]|nr:SUMF1/EgtB/PvdO family nonheme iron enzyme [Planctomycetota bacterium]
MNPQLSPARTRSQSKKRRLKFLTALPLLFLLSACRENSASTGDPGKDGPQSGGPSQSHSEVYVSAGSFDMGSNYGEADEQPIIRVDVDPFYIDKYEVTNAQYKVFLAAVKNGAKRVLHEDCPKDKDHQPSPAKNSEINFRFPKDYFSNPKFDTYPVVGIDWYDAYTYAAWAGRRLPSEAEWEYAARSVENREFPWGSERPLTPTAKANYFNPRPNRKGRRDLERLDKFSTTAVFDHADGFPFIAPVGSYPEGKAKCGAMDMAGNVWEWTSSSYHLYGKKSPKNTKILRVLRGGAWDSPSSFLFRTSNRVSVQPNVRRVSIGFRTARSLKEGEK